MRKTLLALSSLVLLGGLVVFVLEKTHIIDFYHKNITQASTAKPVNTIDYSPATASDNANNSQIKQNSLNNTPVVRTLSITITRAVQDPTTKILSVRAIVDGGLSGTCTLEMSQNGGSSVLRKQASVVQQNNIFVCSGFDIARSEIPGAGNWTIKIIFNSGPNDASATQTITLEG